MYNVWCFVAFYAVLLQNFSFMRFTLFCREICFVAIYALWRGEKLGQQFCLWRKKDKYQVWDLRWKVFFPEKTEKNEEKIKKTLENIITENKDDFKNIGATAIQGSAKKINNE